jgi:hypothetical protein
MTKKTATPLVGGRRTPAQIAAAELTETGAQLAKIETRIVRLNDDLAKATRRRDELARLHAYRAAHPLLVSGAEEVQ